jgi:hypothetical protein
MKNFVPATHTQSASKFFPFGFCRIEHKMYVSVCVCMGRKKSEPSLLFRLVRWRIRFVGPRCHFALVSLTLAEAFELIKMQIKLPHQGEAEGARAILILYESEPWKKGD